MFLHYHPYEPFLFDEATKLIVGTLPPPRFTSKELKPDDVDFCYGSRDGQLWPILDRIFNLGLKYECSSEAVQERKNFLRRQKIGICDIVESAEREKIDASDLGMQHVKLRDLIVYLNKYPKVDTLLFTGGNSKNGPEYFFRKLLKEYDINLEVVSAHVPRIHCFSMQSLNRKTQEVNGRRIIRTVSLTAPSGAANRAVGSIAAYKKLKEKNPTLTTIDFRVLQYRPFF